MSGFYPNKPPDASNGEAFDLLCRKLWRATTGQELNRCLDARSQFTIGDTLEGFEFKELKNAKVRLHIEIAERTAISRPWISSGIYSQSAASRYMCGSHDDIFIFDKDDLKIWHKQKTPKEILYPDDPERATIRSFILEKNDAAHLCLWRFIRQSRGWGWRAIKNMPQHEIDVVIAEKYARAA